MSKLVRLSWGRAEFSIDPDLVKLIFQDTDDGSCQLLFEDGTKHWVNGTLDELEKHINEGRTK